MNISDSKNIELPYWQSSWVENIENFRHLPDLLKTMCLTDAAFNSSFKFLLNEPDLYTDKDGEEV